METNHLIFRIYLLQPFFGMANCQLYHLFVLRLASLFPVQHEREREREKWAIRIFVSVPLTHTYRMNAFASTIVICAGDCNHKFTCSMLNVPFMHRSCISCTPISVLNIHNVCKIIFMRAICCERTWMRTYAQRFYRNRACMLNDSSIWFCRCSSKSVCTQCRWRSSITL